MFNQQNDVGHAFWSSFVKMCTRRVILLKSINIIFFKARSFGRNRSGRSKIGLKINTCKTKVIDRCLQEYNNLFLNRKYIQISRDGNNKYGRKCDEIRLDKDTINKKT